MEASALYDFTSEQDGDLSFKRGDVLKVLNMEDEDWYKAELNGNKGLVPRTYIKMEPHEWFKGKMNRAEAEGFLMRTNASGAHAYEDGTFLLRLCESGKGDFSLSVKHGSCPQHFLIRSTDSGDYFLWPSNSFHSINRLIDYYRHTSVSDKSGVTLLLRDRTKADPNMFEAIHDFKPESPDEVAFKRGDRIKLMDKTDEGWWTGMVMRTEQQGLFPSTYVKAVK